MERSTIGDVVAPTAARMYDFLLGDAHNLAADRTLALRLENAVPEVRRVIQLNRTFLRRAVVFLVENGIRQFVDIGSSIPTTGNAGQIARNIEPESRVVRVDPHPITLSPHKSSPDSGPDSTTVRADFRAVDRLFASPALTRVLDPRRPIGLLMTDVLHYVPESQEPAAMLAGYRQLLPAGSYLVIAHLTADHCPDPAAAGVEVMRHSRDPLYPRTHAEIVHLFSGFELIDPGVVDIAGWYQERELEPAEKRASAACYAGVGRKS